MSAVNATAMLTCANCADSFPAPTVRRGKIQIYCGNDCQIQAANKRRSSTRAGRINGITYPHAGETPGQPSSPDPMRIPPSVDMAASDRPSTPKDRLSELMEKAHSRGGVNALRLPPLRSYGASPMGSAGKDTRTMTHSRKSAAQRAKSLERLMAFREMKAAPALQPARPASPPPPPPDFSIRTLDGASWSEDSRYMRWTLPVNTGRVVGGIPRNF